MKYQKGFSIWTAVFVAAVISVGIVGYVWYITRPTSTTQEIAQVVVPTIVPAGTSPVVQAVEQTVVEHTSQAVLNSLDAQRQQGADQTTKTQIAALRSAAQIYYDTTGNGSYGATTSSCSSGMFADTNSGMAGELSLSHYPDGTQLTCNVGSASASYAIEASLLGGGYWCADSSGQIKAETVSLGAQTKCQ